MSPTTILAGAALAVVCTLGFAVDKPLAAPPAAMSAIAQTNFDTGAKILLAKDSARVQSQHQQQATCQAQLMACQIGCSVKSLSGNKSENVAADLYQFCRDSCSAGYNLCLM